MDKTNKSFIQLGWRKEYLIIQATNLLGHAADEIKFGYLQHEDEHIAEIMELLKAYPHSENYFSNKNREQVYQDFCNSYFPKTMDLLKDASHSGRFNRDKWNPLIKLFLENVSDYLIEYKEWNNG